MSSDGCRYFPRGVALADRTPLVVQHLAMGIVQDPDQVWTLWKELVATPQWSDSRSGCMATLTPATS